MFRADWNWCVPLCILSERTMKIEMQTGDGRKKLWRITHNNYSLPFNIHSPCTVQWPSCSCWPQLSVHKIRTINIRIILFHISIDSFRHSLHLQCFDGGPPIQLKEEPEDGGMRSVQKVPSISDLSDPEASLGKSSIQFVKSLHRYPRLNYNRRLSTFAEDAKWTNGNRWAEVKKSQIK